jgi:hypothetical protein
VSTGEAIAAIVLITRVLVYCVTANANMLAAVVTISIIEKLFYGLFRNAKRIEW